MTRWRHIIQMLYFKFSYFRPMTWKRRCHELNSKRLLHEHNFFLPESIISIFEYIASYVQAMYLQSCPRVVAANEKKYLEKWLTAKYGNIENMIFWFFSNTQKHFFWLYKKDVFSCLIKVIKEQRLNDNYFIVSLYLGPSLL